jgi:glycosyltransferase involved in cell wall biosynthesis
MKKIKQRILIITPAFIPSAIIGVMRPLAELESRNEIDLRLRLYNFKYFQTIDVEWCDVAVFCRSCEAKDLLLLYELKCKGKKVVYEIDDNFEEIPLTTDIGVHHRSFFRLHVLKRFFALSDVSRVYSERMLERAHAHGANAQLIRSYFDKSLIDGAQIKPTVNLIKIAYPTGRIDDRNLEELFFTAVRTILEKYAGKIEFHLWRKSAPKQLSGVDGLVLNKPVRSYDNFVCSLYHAGFTIGLAPGIDTPFFRSKTNNKYREFGGCGIAGIYSNFPPYSNTVDHEHTGLLAGNSANDWVAAIERLVFDIELRERIVKNAREDVFINYSFDRAVESWLTCLNGLSNEDVEAPKWLPSPKQFPIFAAVTLSSVNQLDRHDDRQAHLMSACSAIQGLILERFSSTEAYLKSSFRKLTCATFFAVNDEHELSLALQVIDLCTSAIIDLTKYRDDVDRAINHLRENISSVPLSFLFTVVQADGSALIQTLPENFLTLKIQSSSIAEEFSLSGYPAAYIDIIEQHIHYGTVKKSSGLLHRLQNKIHAHVDRYVILKGRFYALLMLAKWRLGIRHF